MSGLNPGDALIIILICSRYQKFNYRSRLICGFLSVKDSVTNSSKETRRQSKQIDRTDALLGGLNVNDASELPLMEPTGEKTRKTYDFTSKAR